MSYPVAKIKNIDTVDHSILGTVVSPNEEYTISDEKRIAIANNDGILTKISEAKLQVGNGSVYFSSVNDQINLLKANLPASVDLTQKTASKGIPKVAVVKPDGDDFISVVSHEFTTKTSWYGQSTRVTSETLTGSGTGPYSAVNDYWIDMTSGNIVDEDTIGTPYLVKIYDDGVEQTSGFSIDYELGEVTFDSAPTGPVTADYSYAGESTWTLKPDTGKVINIKHAELDFTIDSDLHKVHFEIWAYNPLDLPNKVMVNRRTYKNIKDVVKIANEIQVIDAIGGIGQKLVRAVFDYAEIIELKDSQGLELRVKIDDDVPFTGTFSSVTVYTTIEDE